MLRPFIVKASVLGYFPLYKIIYKYYLYTYFNGTTACEYGALDN